MKHRASLAFLELAVMLLVFALAAALCLQVFLRADDLSRQAAVLDRAVAQAQQAAELLKHGNSLPARTAYDEDWNATGGDAAYVLQIVSRETGVPGLDAALVTVSHTQGEVIYALDVAWQEGGGP